MSWAEDMGFDAYDPEDAISDTKEYEWEDKHHNIHLISDLSDEHLQAIIKGFSKTFAHKTIIQDKYWGQRWKLDYLKKEALKRQKALLAGKEKF